MIVSNIVICGLKISSFSAEISYLDKRTIKCSNKIKCWHLIKDSSWHRKRFEIFKMQTKKLDVEKD